MKHKEVNKCEIIIRLILDIHYDTKSKQILPSAFQTRDLKHNGLSVNIKSKFTQTIKNNVLSELQKNGAIHKFDIEAKCSSIISLKINQHNIFSVLESPIQNNPIHADNLAHANIWFNTSFISDKKSKLKKYRKKLMDEFK